MPPDYTGRIWKFPAGSNSTTPFGTLNIKVKGGSWTGGTSNTDTFTITDIAGRTYTFTWSTNSQQITFGELGWISGPITFVGPTHGEVDLFLATSK